ncbi:unnamed protein product, partial [Ceratitis capitata]
MTTVKEANNNQKECTKNKIPKHNQHNTQLNEENRCCSSFRLTTTATNGRRSSVAQPCYVLEPQARVACKFRQLDNECGMLMMEFRELQ